MWQSPDPLIPTYLTGFPGGGVYIPGNLGAYSYAQQRPVVANDPSGEWINFVVGGIKGAIENVVIQNIEIAAGVRDEFSWGELAVDTAIGTVTSGTGGTARNAARVANAIDAGRTGDRAQDASSATRIARNDAPADMAEQSARQTDEAVDAASASSTFRSSDGRLRNADGTFAPDGGSSRPLSSGTHGNTAGDQPATLYERYDADGNFLKHGISQDPSKRYTRAELDGGFLVETQTGPRREMLAIERDLVETNPGSLNREPWAGSRLAE